MFGVIDNYDFGEMEVMKYYAPPASWTDAKKKETVRNRIFSGEWLAARKEDGFFGKFVKDDEGNMLLYSRSRGVNKQFANKINWVPQLQDFFDSLPNGTCLLGELYLPEQPGSKCVQTILGCLEDKAIARQEKGEKINFYIFDCLAYKGKNVMADPYIKRAKLVSIIISKYTENNPYVKCAEYFSGQALWEELQRILAEGGEGMVIMHQNGVYEPGKRPSKTTLKVKKEITQTIDCFFTGRATAPTHVYSGKEIETWQYWEDSISGEKRQGEFYDEYTKGSPITPVTKPYFYGWAGSLEIAVVRSGEVFPIGFLSGLADEIKANFQDYANRPIEITAMEVLDTGGLRHAKFLQFRDDLTIADCSYEKIFGK